MKQFQSVNPRRLILFAVVLVVLSGILFFYMRDLVREVIVLPLSYLFYLGGIFIDTTPQVFFWLAIMLISIWIAYRNLNRRQKLGELGLQSRPVVDHHSETTGRMGYWVVKMNILRKYRGSYFMGGFHQSLARLVIDLLAHRNRLTQSQVEDQIRSGLIDLPDDVKDYLMFSLGRPQINIGGLGFWWQEILRVIRNWLHWPALQQKEEPLADRAYQRIDMIIQYMEEELDISHEHPNQSSR